MPWYAWSNISRGKDRAGRLIRTPVGTEVTVESLEMTQKEFDELVDSGAIRETPYPPLPAGSLISPTEYNRRQLRIAEGQATQNDLFAGPRLPDGLQSPEEARSVLQDPSTVIGG